MSLKAFHIVFVTVSILCLFGFGVWALNAYFALGDVWNLAMGLVSLLGCGVMVVYGKWFLKKLKGWSYL